MRFLLISFFLSFYNYLSAQQVELTTENIDNDGYNEARVIGQDDDGFYVLQSNISLDSQRNRVGFKTRKLKITYFSGTLKPKWTLPLIPAQDNGNIDQVVYGFEKLLLISAVESKSDPVIEGWIQQINNHGTGPVPGNKVASFAFNRSSDLDKLKFIAASDQHAAMIVLKENTDDGKQVLHATLLDSVLKPVSTHHFTIPYNTRELSVEDYKLSSEGDLAVLGFLTKKEKDKGGEKTRIAEYHLFSIPANSDQVYDLPVKSGDKSLAQAALVIDNLHHHAVVMGFYADKNSLTGTGIFYATHDFKKNSLLDVRTNPLDGGQHQNLIGERNSNNSNGISNYPVQKIIMRNDGGAVIIAEAAYTSEYSYYDYFTQSLIRHIEYHFDNVIVVSVNNDCSVDWGTVVHKRQESTDDGGVYSSFCTLINSDEIIVVYNKDFDRNQSATAGIISNRGDQKEMDISKSTEHMLLLPTWGKQISENEVVIPVLQKKKLFLSKISF